MKERDSHIDRLAQDIKNGDVKAFRELYQLMSDRIFRYAYSFVLSREEAEEIMHDVFLRVWDKRSEIHPYKSFSSFLFTITKNLTLDRIRHYSMTLAHLQKYFKAEEKKPQNAVEQKVLYNELSQTIEEIIDSMPDRRKKVYLLSRNEGMTNKAIAESLHISVTAVEKHIRLAMNTLRFELKKREWPLILIFFLLFFH